MTIAIGVPLRGEYIPVKFWESTRLLAITEPIKVITKIGYNIDLARNLIVEDALKSNCSHLLFLDDDTIFPEDTLIKLRSHEKDIAAGLYFTRKLPHRPAALRMYEKPIDGFMSSPITDYNKGLTECDTVGMGCTLIKMDIFKKMKRPWFEYHKDYDKKTIIQYAEDDWFCIKAKRLGYKVYVDTDIKCGHLCTKVIDEDYLKK